MFHFVTGHLMKSGQRGVTRDSGLTTSTVVGLLMGACGALFQQYAAINLEAMRIDFNSTSLGLSIAIAGRPAV